MNKTGKPIISVSGVRGEVGTSLDIRVITQFAMAFGTFVGGKTVIVGRDSRTSSPMLRYAVLAGLFATGCHVIDVGLTMPNTDDIIDGKSTARTRKYNYYSQP